MSKPPASKEGEKDLGSFVEQPPPTEATGTPVEGDTNIPVLERIANALETLAQTASGVGTTNVTIKTAIDENTKVLAETRDKLDSLLTILVVDSKDAKKGTTPVVKATQPKTETPSPTPQVTTAKPPVAKPESNTHQGETATATAPPDANLQKIRESFTQDLENLLMFEDKGDFYAIKPKEFLGSENFAKIAKVVREIGGEYISAGRDSHFRVYKK